MYESLTVFTLIYIDIVVLHLLVDTIDLGD